MKCNQSRPGFELVSPCPFPTTITITPQAPPPTTNYHIVAFSLDTWMLLASNTFLTHKNSANNSIFIILHLMLFINLLTTLTFVIVKFLFLYRHEKGNSTTLAIICNNHDTIKYNGYLERFGLTESLNKCTSTSCVSDYCETFDSAMSIQQHKWHQPLYIKPATKMR